MTDRNTDTILNEFDKYLNDFVDRIFQLSQENLINDGKTDTGTLLKSGNVQRDFLSKSIIYSSPYADVVEYGRSKGSPMYSGWLHKWVRRKLGINNTKEIKQVSYAIAKAIEKRGIKETLFLQRAIDQASTEFGVELMEE